MSTTVPMNEVGDREATTDGPAEGRLPDVPGVALKLSSFVLAGGSGTRLWPVSRRHYPKQLIDVIGPDSLLQTTVRRLVGVESERALDKAPIIVCGGGHRFMTSQQLGEAGVEARIVVEPAGRNTAPALTLAAMLACAGGDDSTLVVM